MVAPRRRCLDYSKAYSDVIERSFAWHENKQITYYIFYILIPSLVLIFLTIAQICYHRTSIISCY